MDGMNGVNDVYLYNVNWTKSLEVLAAEQMTFESFCKCLGRQR